MELRIKKFILILLMITFPLTLHSKDSCPKSSCGSSLFPITYPFKLQTDEPPVNCHSSINLRCDDQGHTVMNIPSLGDFFVTDINYDYRKIALTYAGDCLPRMLMTNFSVSPLAAFSFENNTFYTCGKSTFIGRFEVQCLSNSANATVVMTRDSSGYFEGLGCKPMVSSMIPVSSLNEHEDWENFGQLELTWNFPSCRHCEHFLDSDKQGETRSKLVKLITGSTVFIPLAVIFTTFFGIACCIRLLKLISGGGTTAENAESGTTTDSPQATAAAPRTTSETSKVESFSQVMVLNESHQETSICCSICLEEYHGKDRVRSLSQCGHLFHAECIDQWLQKTNTCPMCRSSLSVF